MIAARYRAAVKANWDAEDAARLHRAIDPLELAKRFLQTKGVTVYSEAIYGGARDRFVIGTLRQQTSKQLIRRAELLGYKQEKVNGKKINSEIPVKGRGRATAKSL